MHSHMNELMIIENFFIQITHQKMLTIQDLRLIQGMVETLLKKNMNTQKMYGKHLILKLLEILTIIT